MAHANLPCGCMMEWDDNKTTVVFCDRHTIDYVRWEGSDRDFKKIIATPERQGRQVAAG